MVKRVQSPEQQANGASEGSHEYSGSGENYVMSFDIVDVADLSVKDVSFEKVQNRSQNGTISPFNNNSFYLFWAGTSSSFRTDVDISGNLAIRERNLQKWEPSEDAGLEMSLDDSKGGWDQFEANERLYGVKSDYDENIYTTTIDRTNPLYRQRLAQAEKIAREIDESNALNAHVAEERGQASPGDGGADEEEKYVPSKPLNSPILIDFNSDIAACNVDWQAYRPVNRTNTHLRRGEHLHLKRQSREHLSTLRLYRHRSHDPVTSLKDQHRPTPHQALARLRPWSKHNRREQRQMIQSQSLLVKPIWVLRSANKKKRCYRRQNPKQPQTQLAAPIESLLGQKMPQTT